MNITLNKRFFLVFVLIGIAFYILMVFSPLAIDDYDDCFLWDTTRRLSSLGDYLKNLYLHYFHVSARLVPHFCIEFFGVFLGKTVFNILNTLVFLSFLILVTRYSLGDGKRIEFSTLFVFATCLLFILMPGFNDVFLWRSGSCNYLWSGTLSLAFLSMMKKSSSRSYHNPLVLWLIGLVCGWTNEAITVGIVGAWILYCAFHKDSFSKRRLFLLSGYCSGVLMLIVSPISLERALMSNEESLVSARVLLRQFSSSLLAIGNLRLFPLLLLLLVIFTGLRRLDVSFYKENAVEFLALMISLLFIIITHYSSSRSRFGIELFSLILTLRLLFPILEKLPDSFFVLNICVLLGIFIPTVYYSFLNHQEYKRCITQIQHPDSFIIQTEEVMIPPFFDRLVLRFVPSEKNPYYRGFLGDPSIERYFGKKTLCFLPKRFLETSKKDGCFQEFDIHTDLPFYAIMVDPDISIQEIQLILAPADPNSTPFVFRPVMNKFDRWSIREISVDKWRIITIPHSKAFLLVGKNLMVQDRVSSIVIK